MNKKIITICAAFLITASVFAQSPEKMSYQAVVRDGSNNLVSSTVVGMQISILQGSSSGTAVYIETQTPTTNTNGMVSLEIGSGTVVSGTFATIDWANGSYFIKTETDPTGGTSYTITGTSQLLSVPYALHAKTAESVSTTLTIGQSYQGGIIFWLDATGKHGLIAATADQSISIRWDNDVTNVVSSDIITNAVRDGIGAGMFNTERIISKLGVGDYAAQLCANYQGGGYGDWYLPSKYELNLLFLQKTAVGGFSSDFYWSSNEDIINGAYGQHFNNGNIAIGNKDRLSYVRAVRAF